VLNAITFSTQNGCLYHVHLIYDIIAQPLYPASSFALPLRITVCVQEDEKPSDTPCFKSTLWGPSLDSHDKVYDAISLPEVDIGEWLRIKDMGAYTESAASKFNAMQPSENYYCVSEANRYRSQYSSSQSCSLNLGTIMCKFGFQHRKIRTESFIFI